MSAEQSGGTPGSGAMSDRMRALLSRAAEEQLHEQRQVSTVLGELRSLLEDVDERLATGERLERVAAEVRTAAASLEARLDAAEARSAELAERISDAGAMVGQAAQDVVEAVAARVAERLEEQLQALAAELTTSVDGLVTSSERRLAVHVDDAVLALAEVVLRRGRPVARPAAAPEVPVDEAPVEALPDGPPREAPADEAGLVDVRPAGAQTDPDAAAPAADVPPGEGFVLVPADLEDSDAAPTPVVAQERRTADRRTSARSDGTGRRSRPWWRPV